ncbi:MAG: exonuclease SbcCD subunit D [Frankiaceae bacterium]
MRLLHTSDWHLGRSFHGVDLLAAQASVVDALVDVVRSERVDAVLVAGDLYDRALPPVEAVELWGQALERLADAGAAVIAISGNHDSARRLGGGGVRLLERAAVHLRTDVRAAGSPVLLADEHGEVAVYPVPYLDPDTARWLLDADGEAAPAPRSHAAVLRAALDRCRADLRGRRGVRSVAMAHAFVAGGTACDSERALSVGGAGEVPPGALAGFDYVALGHLHGRQVVGDGAVRYAGSPLPYSFSEAGHVKGAWLVELGAGGLGAVEAVPMPVPRRLVRLRGRLDDLLASSAHGEAEAAFVSVTLTDPACPAGAMRALQRRFPHAVELSWAPEGGLVHLGDSYAARVRQPDDLAVVTAFVSHVRNAPPTEVERALLGEIVASAGRQPVGV